MWRFYLLFAGAGLTALGGLYLAHSPDPAPVIRLLVALGGAASALLARKALMPLRQSTAFGSASLATYNEISDLLREKDAPPTPGSVLLGQRGGLSLILPPDQARRHGIIVGGSGSGKSFSFFLPNAARLRGTSCVFTDPKSELHFHTSGFHESLRFAPCEPGASECFNWIPLCREPRIAEMAARAIVESGKTPNTEQAWMDMEAAYLASLFSHASTLPVPTPLTAYRLFTGQNQKTLLAQLAKSRSPVAREQANIFGQTSERMRGAIVPIVAARLQFLRDPAVARFCSATLIAPPFARLRRVPTALYWCLHEKDIPRLRPLTSLFFTLLLEALNEAKDVPVLLFLDEFGVIGALPDFHATIALARGRGMGFWLGVQSLAQLEALYGRPAAQTILTNCATKVALAGLDVETAEYFSRSLGQGTLSRRTLSRQRRRFALLASSTGEADQEHGRPLLTADEVRRLPDGEMLVVTGNRRPMTLDKIRYDVPPDMAQTGSLGAARAQPVRSQAESAVVSGSLVSGPPPFPEDL